MRHLYLLGTHTSLFHGTMRKRFITISYHATENTEAKTAPNFGGNKITAHHGKVGYNTVEYTTVYLLSDWLYFLCNGIKLDNYIIRNKTDMKMLGTSNL